MIGAYAVNGLDINVDGATVVGERVDNFVTSIPILRVVTRTPPVNEAAPTPLYRDAAGAVRPAAFPSGYISSTRVRFTHPSIRFIRGGNVLSNVFPAPFMVTTTAVYGDETCARPSGNVSAAPRRTFSRAPARRTC